MDHVTPIAVKGRVAAQMLGIGLTKLDELIAAGLISAKRSGKNRLITISSLKQYVDGLPDARSATVELPYRRQRKAAAEAADRERAKREAGAGVAQ